MPPLAGGPKGSGVSSRASGELRFRHEAAKVGDEVVIRVLAESEATDAGPGSRYTSVVRVTVLATSGGAASRVKVAFEENLRGPPESMPPTPVHQKTYVLAENGEVHDEQGGAASEEESDAVRAVNPDLGTRARMDEILPDAPMRVGDRRDEVARATLRILHPAAWTFVSGTATVARVDGDTAVFDVALQARSQRGLLLDIHGEVNLAARDGRAEKVALDGVYEGMGPKAPFKYRRSVTDSPAPASPAP